MEEKNRMNAFMFEDEEDSAVYEKNCNKRKTLAPMYIYEILTIYTSPYKHYTQRDILEKLEEYPYELDMERKAIGRIVNLLAEEDYLHIRKDKNGVWYDKNYVRYDEDDEDGPKTGRLFFRFSYFFLCPIFGAFQEVLFHRTKNTGGTK